MSGGCRCRSPSLGNSASKSLGFQGPLRGEEREEKMEGRKGTEWMEEKLIETNFWLLPCLCSAEVAAGEVCTATAVGRSFSTEKTSLVDGITIRVR